jgi:hypothetical protein
VQTQIARLARTSATRRPRWFTATSRPAERRESPVAGRRASSGGSASPSRGRFAYAYTGVAVCLACREAFCLHSATRCLFELCTGEAADSLHIQNHFSHGFLHRLSPCCVVFSCVACCAKLIPERASNGPHPGASHPRHPPADVRCGGTQASVVRAVGLMACPEVLAERGDRESPRTRQSSKLAASQGSPKPPDPLASPSPRTRRPPGKFQVSFLQLTSYRSFPDIALTGQ